jgi:hypothetical protein
LGNEETVMDYLEDEIIEQKIRDTLSYKGLKTFFESRRGETVGIACESGVCPVAEALHAAFGDSTFVSVLPTFVYVRQETVNHIRCPRLVVRLIDLIDSWAVSNDPKYEDEDADEDNDVGHIKVPAEVVLELLEKAHNEAVALEAAVGQ